MNKVLMGCASAACLLVAAVAHASTMVVVVGTANPFLAGQPNGFACCGYDNAPAESPTLALTGLYGGEVLTFSTIGGVSHGGGETVATSADGDSVYEVLDGNPPLNGKDRPPGIAGAKGVPYDALVGVFLDGTPSGATPVELDTGTGFKSISPGLDQIFFVGDGLTGTGTGTVQQFVVPFGAETLYLGTADGHDWNDNSGQIDVTINVLPAPEPSTWALMIAGVATLGATLRYGRRRGWSMVSA